MAWKTSFAMIRNRPNLRANTLARSAILSRSGSPLWLHRVSERVCRPIARHHAKTERRYATATNNASGAEGGSRGRKLPARAASSILLLMTDYIEINGHGHGYG